MSQSYAKSRPEGTPDRPAPTIRRATPADTEALVAIGRATFAETFGHLYPQEDRAAFLAEAHGLARGMNVTIAVTFFLEFVVGQTRDHEFILRRG